MKKGIVILLAALLLSGCAASAPAATVPETTVPETTALEVVTVETETLPETTPVQPPVITKDPTGEKLSPGGKTWFVAHADGATILTWEFLSPDGTVYSVAEAMAQNPGLLLDISKADTVELQNVPLSFNGWSARARFDGPGGSVTSAAALVTVTQNLGGYDTVISKYETAMSHKGEGDEVPFQYDVSEMMLYVSHVGYALQDLDGDGTQELLIAGIGYDIPGENSLLEIFTLQNGTPVSVVRSQVRDCYYLMNDGKLYNEGSSGAMSSNFSVMQYSGGTVRFLNGLYTWGDGDSFGYYYTTSNQYGDPALLAGDSKMEEKAADAFLTNWRNSTVLPPLSLIA